MIVPSDKSKDTDDYIKELTTIYGDGFYSLLEVPEIQRLAGVGFLGTLAAAYGKQDSSRLDHSLSVARLAFHVAEQVKLTEVERDAFMLYHIVHDIGHPPHSHVAEPLLRIFQPRYKFHEALGKSQVQSLERVKKWCGEVLTNGYSVWEALLSLLETNSKGVSHKNLGIQIKRCLLNVDNVEGIIRTATTLGVPAPAAEKILTGIRRDGDTLIFLAKCLPLAIEFWRTQSHIYKDYVFSLQNQSAEAILKKCLLLAVNDGLIKDDFSSLTDKRVFKQISSHPKTEELLGVITEGKCLSPLWMLDNKARWDSTISKIGARICANVEILTNIDILADSLPNFPSGMNHFLALHCTRWKEFNIDEAKIIQEQLIDIPIEGLASFFSVKKTTTVIPITLFGPPAIAHSDVLEHAQNPKLGYLLLNLMSVHALDTQMLDKDMERISDLFTSSGRQRK